MSELNRVLIVGAGSIGERHVRCFQATKRADVSICEINGLLREQVAGRYGVERSYAHLDAALSQSYEAAVICTPAHLHVPMASRLAEAGVHLLIEKPLSTNLEGVEELREFVRERGVVAVVAYVYRAHPALSAMKQAIDAGRFGRPVQIVAHCGQHFPTYRPAYREIYYTNRATGGGAVQDALTHVINAAEWLVGPAERVAADAAHQVLEAVEVEDTVHVLARHGRVLGCYSLNQYQAPNELTLTVTCQQGTVRFENHRNRWRWMTEPGGPWNDEPIADLQRDRLFTIQANRFLDAIEGKAVPLCSLDEGVQTLRVNLAILESDQLRRWVSARSGT